MSTYMGMMASPCSEHHHYITSSFFCIHLKGISTFLQTTTPLPNYHHPSTASFTPNPKSFLSSCDKNTACISSLPLPPKMSTYHTYRRPIDGTNWHYPLEATPQYNMSLATRQLGKPAISKISPPNMGFVDLMQTSGADFKFMRVELCEGKLPTEYSGNPIAYNQNGYAAPDGFDYDALKRYYIQEAQINPPTKRTSSRARNQAAICPAYAPDIRLTVSQPAPTTSVSRRRYTDASGAKYDSKRITGTSCSGQLVASPHYYEVSDSIQRIGSYTPTVPDLIYFYDRNDKLRKTWVTDWEERRSASSASCFVYQGRGITYWCRSLGGESYYWQG